MTAAKSKRSTAKAALRKTSPNRSMGHRLPAHCAKISLGLLILASLLVAAMCSPVQLWSQSKQVADYPIQGFDVSRHQGQIDWTKIDPKRYQFVFIKASEGGDYHDPNFARNWRQARAQGLKVGAYHFFRNCKTGAEQAANFIAQVPKHSDSLAPVIDLEFQWNCPEVSAEQLQQQIAIMAESLAQHYGQSPLFYTTPNYYRSYIHGALQRYPVWIQDMSRQAIGRDAQPWLFWQYSAQGRIPGIQTAVDLNLFAGDRRAWQQLSDGQAPRLKDH
jgi:lysozyme